MHTVASAAKAPGLRDILLAVEGKLHSELPYDPRLVKSRVVGPPSDSASFSLLSFRMPSSQAPTLPLSHQEPGDTNSLANALLKPTEPLSEPQLTTADFYALPERPEGEPKGINSVLIKLTDWGNTRSLDDLRQDGLLERMFSDQDPSAFLAFEAILRAQSDDVIRKLLTGTAQPKYELDFGLINYSKSCADAFVSALYTDNPLVVLPSDDVAKRWLASGVGDAPDMSKTLDKICTTQLFLSGRFNKVVPNWPYVDAADGNPRDEMPPNGVRNPSAAEWLAAANGYTREGIAFRPDNPVIAFFARIVCNRLLSDVARVLYDGQPRRLRLPMNLFSTDDLMRYIHSLVAVFERWTPVFPSPEPSASSPGTAWKIVMAERMEDRFFYAIEDAMPVRPSGGLRNVIKWRRNQTASQFATALRDVLRAQGYCAPEPNVIAPSPSPPEPEPFVAPLEPVGTPLERFLRQTVIALGGDPEARKDDIARIIETIEKGDVIQILEDHADIVAKHDNLYLSLPCPLVERLNRDELSALPLPAPGSLGIYEGVRHLLFPYPVGSSDDIGFLSRSFSWTNSMALEYGWWDVFLREVAAHAKTAHICSLDSAGRPLAVHIITEDDHPFRKEKDIDRSAEAYTTILREVLALNGTGISRENVPFLKPWPHAMAVWGPQKWLHQSEGRTECTTEKPWMPVVVTQHATIAEGHRTLMLINRATGVAYYFEPNGGRDDAELAFVVPTLRAFLVEQGVIDAARDMRRLVVLDSPEQPGIGPQEQQNSPGNIVLEDRKGTCVIWSQLFFHLFVINPQLSPQQIVVEMLRGELKRKLGMIISRYAMWLAESSEKTIKSIRKQ